MSFAPYEESAESGQPVQLFLFRYGPLTAEYYAYTDHYGALTVSSIAYEPVPIERDAIDANGTLDKSNLTVRLDIGTELAELFRVYPPPNVVSLVIAAGHVGDPDSQFIVSWAGRVVGATRDGSELVLSCEPVSTSMRRPGLRRHYQIGCMHQLFGPQCQADKDAATVASTVSSISGATVTLPGGWNGAFAAEKFLGGLLEWTPAGSSTDRRTILRITGNVLSLSGIPRNLDVADAVDVVLGCNHKAYAEDGGDCQPLHNNILNYGGCRWIPLVNPIGTYNNYY
jgi:hypothetical protein